MSDHARLPAARACEQQQRTFDVRNGGLLLRIESLKKIHLLFCARPKLRRIAARGRDTVILAWPFGTSIDVNGGEGECMPETKTAIVTGATGGIGMGLVEVFLREGYNVVATSLNTARSFAASNQLALVDGDIGEQETAVKVAAAATERFGRIDALVNNAGIYLTRPFLDFTTQDFQALVSTNLLGFLYITQYSVKQMLKQKSGSVVSITAALADQPIAGINASVSMMTKGGLSAVTRSLAMEYAKDGIRFNAVAPGVVESPMHPDLSEELLAARQPMKTVTKVKDIVDAVLYLTRADQVTGEVIHVDGGSHAGRG